MRKADPLLQERRRSEIVAAAAACFTEKGFHQASMADIARVAGMSMGLVYRYFRSKDEIILSFASRDRQLALQQIAALLESADPWALLEAQLDAAVLEAFDPAYARITLEVVAEAARNPPLQLALNADDAAIRVAVAAAIAELQRRGRVRRELDAGLTASVLMALFDGLTGRGLFEPALDRAGFRQALMHLLRGALAVGDGDAE